MTDASLYCIGGTIRHIIDNSFSPIAYASKILTETEQRYPSFKREFLALKNFVNFWRYYLLGNHFIVIVDMKGLTYSSFMKKTNCGVILQEPLEPNSVPEEDVFNQFSITDSVPAVPELVRFQEVEQPSSSRTKNVSTNTSQYDLRPRKRVIY
jgi:hypothetical protein